MTLMNVLSKRLTFLWCRNELVITVIYMLSTGGNSLLKIDYLTTGMKRDIGCIDLVRVRR